MLTLAVVAEPLVQTLLGPAWSASVTALAAFAIMGAFQVLLPLAAIIYRVKGRTDLLLGTPAASAMVAVVGAAIGLRWGIEGAAAGWAIGSTLFAIPSLFLAFTLIDLKGKDVAGAIWPAVNISLITELAAFLWLTTLDSRIPNAPAAIHLFSTAGVALAVYFFLLRALRPGGVEDVEMMLARLPKPLRATHRADRRAERPPMGELQLR
jgi:PST family polysaccharide transporter